MTGGARRGHAIRAHLRLPAARAGWREPWGAAGVESGTVEDGLVFVVDETVGTWDAVAEELHEAFLLCKRSFTAGAPTVFVAHNDDLLGRRGACPAMAACGLLSGARAMAIEGRKGSVRANMVAFEDDTEPAEVARWVLALLDEGSISGEVIHLGGGHLGKALV